MKKETVSKIFHILENYYTKNEIIELKYINNYTLLIAVLLSAQATDKGVNKATEILFQKASTPEEMIKLGEEGIKQYIKSINYYNTKAKNIIKLSQKLIDEYNSQVPSKREDLESLAGVGRKTANVVLNILFNQPNIAVDTHVFRVSNRLGLVKTDNVLDTEKKLNKIVPQQYIKYVNHWLVLLGRYICKAKKPECNKCPIKEFCKSCKIGK